MQIKVAAWPAGTTDRGPSRMDVMNAVNQARSGSGTPFTSFSNALHRYLTLQEFDDASDAPIESTLGNRSWTDPVTETPKVNSTEVWEMINLTPDAHPIHVHLIDFKVLDQQPFDVNSYVPNQP
jgi:FtsP/CotA-like multicopper oxidase with cupredoxin domain